MCKRGNSPRFEARFNSVVLLGTLFYYFIIISYKKSPPQQDALPPWGAAPSPSAW